MMLISRVVQVLQLVERERGAKNRLWRGGPFHARLSGVRRHPCIATRRAGGTERSARERAFVPIEFAFGLGLLVLPVAMLVLVFPTWAERQSIARVAAREAARTYALSGDTMKADAVVRQIATNDGLAPTDMNVVMTGDPKARGGKITADVSVVMPITRVPGSGVQAGTFTVHATHTEIVDLYRSFQ